MKVYDCFTFYNEFELLELRLKALWNVVDCFVIVEADKTHANKPKPFYFWKRQDEFREFFPKIRHLPIEITVPYSGAGDWSIEHAQRDAIAHGLSDAVPDDLIMISDLDEIPAPDVFAHLQENKISLMVPYFPPDGDKKFFFRSRLTETSTVGYLEHRAVVLAQMPHIYYFDLVNRGTWQGTILVKRKNLTTPQKLRELRNHLPRILNGGWHFSYMGGVDRVIDKMNSIVDGNALVVASGGKLTNRAHVEKAITTGGDIYGRKNSEYRFYDAREIRLPYIDEFLRKYPHFLREPEKHFGG